jgi:hypothetical protein
MLLLLVLLQWEQTEALGKKLAEGRPADAKGWSELAEWCEKSNLQIEAEYCFRKAGKNSEKRKPEEVDPKKEREQIGWEFERKIEGQHWTIYTDAPEDSGRAVLKAAEALYDAFVGEFMGLLPMARRVHRAYVFKDKKHFLKEAKLPAAWAEGYYDYDRAACLCYYDPKNDKNPTHWFVHEGHHQLMNELVVKPENLAVWLSEGYACYFGSSRLKDGELKLGEVDPNTFPAFWRRRYGPDRYLGLEEMADRVGPKLVEQKDPIPFYMTAWMLVHYLLRGEGGKHREPFRRFVAQAVRGRSDTAMFEKTVGKFADLQEGYSKFVRDR